MNSIIEARGISYTRQGRKILDEVSLDLSPEKIVTLIGPNGAGKSTFVRILLGIDKPDTGTVNKKPGITIGYMPQKINIDESLPISVKRLLNLPKTQADTDIIDALTLTGIPHLLNQQVHRLSGGELQRVMLARAIVRKPDLLVLDEPVQGVDFTGEIALYELIHQLRKKLSCAILMVSHDLHIVMARTDEVICINQHVCCSGTAETVKSHPEFKQLFGLDQAVLGLYKHNHNHEHGLDEQGHHHG